MADMKLNLLLRLLGSHLWLQGILFTGYFLCCVTAVDSVREQAIIDVASCPENWFDDSPFPSTLTLNCGGDFCPQQPDGWCKWCKSDMRDKHCCQCVYQCTCNPTVCTNLRALTFIFGHRPDHEPETAFLTFLGLGDDAPCCGPSCSMDRCLELVRTQFVVLREPLENERDQTKEQAGLIGDAEDVDCCGSGCPARGCFQTLLDSIILLQHPILETLQNFNKSKSDTFIGV
jgi:hypothetical protein